MLLDQETLRFIFGLKLRGLRLDKGLSLKELSRKTGLSPSYLNEIEKGKKYPKTEKILQLSEALGEDYNDLISLRLKKEMALVSQLIEKNIFSGMPFEIFGIPASTVFSLIADRPKKMSALVGTLLEIARGHRISIDDFFYATLRSYLDMHQNFFPQLEEKVESFRAESSLNFRAEPSEFLEQLKSLLTKKFAVEVLERPFAGDLAPLFFFLRTTPKGIQQVVINSHLPVREKIFVVSRELGAAYMKVKNRPATSLIKNLDTFEQLYHHFTATYFAGALLIPREDFVSRLKSLFSASQWNQKAFEEMVLSYNGPVESVFHRMTQVLPKFLGLEHLYFLRADRDSRTGRLQMVRELHLSELHSPHAIVGDEHYCERWVTSKLLKEISECRGDFLAGIQRSQFTGNTDSEYLNLSCAFHAATPDTASSAYGCVTLGILMNPKAKRVLGFLEDPAIQHKMVASTCERCSIKDCRERQASSRPELLVDQMERIRQAIEGFESI